jgi:signal transduction histidine kinase
VASWATAWLDGGALARLAGWTLIAVVLMAIAAAPVVPVAISDPPLAAAVAAVSSVVGLALLQLEVLRFRALGRPLDLLVGVGFGVLAVEDALVDVVVPGTGLGLARVETLTVLALVARGLAYVLFGLAVPQAGRVLAPSRRPRTAAVGVATGLLSLAMAGAVVFWHGPNLPAALEPEARAGLEVGRAVPTLLDGQAGWLLAANGALAVLLVVATYGLLVLARRLADAYLERLALGLGLLALSQVYGLLFPPGLPGYLGVADLFRLAAYLSLLFGLVSQVTGDVAERAAAEERLRLSRELHDGLAQDLSVLNLRLSEALLACPDAAATSLGRHLQAGRRLARTALLEARQAITALRADSIGWQDFVEALEVFCDEASQNQGVDIRLRVQGMLAVVDADLQVEVLRILNETISNAVRHGAATRIEVGMLVGARPARLVLTVQDNGHGFVPGRCPLSTGVGLRSLAERLERRGGVWKVQSRPADGTLVQVELPIKVRDGRGG